MKHPKFGQAIIECIRGECDFISYLSSTFARHITCYKDSSLKIVDEKQELNSIGPFSTEHSLYIVRVTARGQYNSKNLPNSTSEKFLEVCIEDNNTFGKGIAGSRAIAEDWHRILEEACDYIEYVGELLEDKGFRVKVTERVTRSSQDISQKVQWMNPEAPLEMYKMIESKLRQGHRIIESLVLNSY